MRKSWVVFLLLPLSCHAEFKLGIENIPPSFIAAYTAKTKPRIGLVTNQTGCDQNGNRTLDILLQKKFNIVCIFAPEHGFDGKSLAAQEVTDAKDCKTHIPIISLYGKGSGKKVDPELVKNIDVFFFDIQDSGMRHYTYISTLFTVLKAAQEYNKKIIVFDRPNPLGKTMEGPLVEPSLISFLSIAPIPLRHGMTIGELAEYFNTHVLDTRAALSVIPMKDYDRTAGIAQLHNPLSPNIACKESCHGYSFLGLLGEVEPFDVAVGTGDSFQIISVPESLGITEAIWQALADRLKSFGVSSTPHSFYCERKKQAHHGLRVSIENINHVNAFHAFLATVISVKRAGVAINFKPFFDKCAGSAQVRLFLLGQLSYKELIQEVNQGLQNFFQKAQSVFKYTPHPCPS